MCLLLYAPIYFYPAGTVEKVAATIILTFLNLGAYCLFKRAKVAHRVIWILGLETTKWVAILGAIVWFYNPMYPENHTAALTLLYQYIVVQIYYIAAVTKKLNEGHQN